jgi:chromatin structure-remodeling complex subunit RSC9
MSQLNPISVSSRNFVNASGGNELNGYGNSFNGYGYVAPIGYNHRGAEDVDRIKMSLKSGIDSEIRWALSTLTRVSLHPSFVLENQEFVGHELIKYFLKPYQLIVEKKAKKVTQDILVLSLDALLTLRNLVQDLANQQWLSQIKNFKKNITEALRFLTNWFFHNNGHYYQLQQFDNQFKEALGYLVDLIEPLSCYYIDNTKNDSLFQILLNTSILTTDKSLFVNIVRCLSHLLIIRDKSLKVEEEVDVAGNAEDDTKELERTPNNCIDSIKDSHLEIFVNQLLISDNELNAAVLEFLKLYLTSEALHPEYPNSVKDSQLFRLQYLLQVNTSRATFNTIIKQLPLLIVSNLPLNEPSNIKPITQLNLTKRSLYSGVPTTLPELSEELYSIIVRFPEPLRATTWLRCCYEPYFPHQTTDEENAEVIPGEVTQISLWKAYEKQFQEIWEPSDSSASLYKSLLPAVDFIKNVSHAFPNSEAMVVNLDAVASETPKKKFIIKGIQPRQFAVNIDVGNYEAVKPSPVSSINPGENYKLPIGHIDKEKFDHSLNRLSEGILAEGSRISKDLDFLNPINTTSFELLDYIINEVLETRENSPEENIFRLYNSHWLPDLVYTNPSLVESGLINSKWLKYLI